MLQYEKPLFIRNAAQLITLQGGINAPFKKEKMKKLSIIQNGSMWIEDGIIKMVDKDDMIVRKYADRLEEATIISAKDKIVTPGLIDSHTHLVFGGSREEEFNKRLHGVSYMEIMNDGGGIYSTTRATALATEEQLFIKSLKHLDTFLLEGVTTVEAKSGYGLELEHELKQLRVAKRLNEHHPIDVVSTFMGAHAVPHKYKGNEDEFVRMITEEMLPVIGKQKLAEFNDVFCEQGVFTPAQSKKILESGKEYGLIPKIHADEIVPYEGAETAAKVGAISAEHLLCASDTGIYVMEKENVIAVLLPATAFFLMAPPANARKMIDAGVAVALSTDFNPGSSPTQSLQLVMNLGCLTMNMTPEEVLVATTINAAHAINRGKQIGSLEEGKQADIVLWDAPNYMYLQYQFGLNKVHTVVKNGVVVVEEGRIIKHSKSLY
ncbi:imidazolonepropionase [Bacillus paramycoides]|uniref:imidazolonepropionase n=1 Tax=Bacillus paramycoides TaxID=2026194 RepID=UPI003D076362